MPAKRRDPGRPLVLAGASGGALDRVRGLLDLAKLPQIDVIVGDWMSEANMTVRGAQRREILKASAGKPTAGNQDLYLSTTKDAYDPYFLTQLEPALPFLAQNGIRLACNAGGSNPGGLAETVKAMIAGAGLDLKVAWVEGDDVSDLVLDLAAKGEPLPNLPTGQLLKDWTYDPVCAQAYLGGMGVAAAFEAGADIVLCGRIADASACVAASMWWHGWARDANMDELAGALVAGHCTECSTYVTGGCYAGFKAFDRKYLDMGFPIAIVEANGEFELTMEENRDGEVSVGTVASQVLYEIQGPLYYNSDVVAKLEGIHVNPVSRNRVRVTGVKGLPPPSTTKVGITAHGGYRAEFHYYLTGLDIPEKAEMIELQTRALIGKDIDKFHCLTFTYAGTAALDPRTQDEATVDFRIFAQARDPTVLQNACFGAWCKSTILQSYPGGTPNTDPRQSVGKPYFEYWTTLISQSLLEERVHLPDGTTVEIASPTCTREYPRQQPSYDTSDPVALDSFGATVRAPLGYVVLGRSGDKASDANIGFFVRHDDEWDWLRSLLSLETLRTLLGPEYTGKPIDRFEIPGIRAVHFLLWDHLDRGYNACSKFDSLGKNVVEFLRAKHVDIPRKFLERGRV